PRIARIHAGSGAFAGPTNQANLNLGMIKELQVPCPPMDRQLEFVERSIATESILGQQAAASEKAVAAFDALLSRAFG
ncbi:MAG: hypothetical protein KJZ81_19670, partial [Burkholderiaceae bacterium]|nr:hypothetical protein [Burkholderiaceae bacterium]